MLGWEFFCFVFWNSLWRNKQYKLLLKAKAQGVLGWLSHLAPHPRVLGLSPPLGSLLSRESASPCACVSASLCLSWINILKKKHKRNKRKSTFFCVNFQWGFSFRVKIFFSPTFCFNDKFIQRIYKALLIEKDLQIKITLVLDPDFKLIALGKLDLFHGYWVCFINICMRTELVSYS